MTAVVETTNNDAAKTAVDVVADLAVTCEPECFVFSPLALHTDSRAVTKTSKTSHEDEQDELV